MNVDDVLARLASERPIDRESGPWTVQFIRVADRQFGGRWSQRMITGDDALRILVPRHAGEPCRGDRLTLVETPGADVASAARALEAIRAEYARQNPSCWERISRASSAPYSTIILTLAPLDTDEHREIAAREGALYHLDGFHRLLGWAVARRLTNADRIPAIVAG